ncbi:MAG: ABC transporter ATP-binding protein [Planctomycetota bacterium]
MSGLLQADFEKRFRGGPVIRARLDMPAEGAAVTALLGPSGCGKTTVLRCLAGLERPDAGSIRFAGEAWFDADSRACLSPQRRRVGYLCQEYALFPHLSVAENIGYGLPRAGRSQLVAGMLERFALAGLDRRFPHEISGGQQQRVALVRTVIRRPRLILLDEPLSALDSLTRDQLRRELRHMLTKLAIPVVVVTHDRIEAITLADHVIVMADGGVLQAGSVEDVFSRPSGLAVARIVGVETVVRGHVLRQENGLAVVQVGPTCIYAVSDEPLAGEVDLCIRAEDVIVLREEIHVSSVRNRLAGFVRAVAPEGSVVRVEIDCGFPLTALVTKPACEELALGEGVSVFACIKATAVHVIPRE